jgi:hypothetical protein
MRNWHCIVPVSTNKQTVMTVLLSGVNMQFDLATGNTFAVAKNEGQIVDNTPLHIEQILTPEWWESLTDHDANLLHYYYMTTKYGSNLQG